MLHFKEKQGGVLKIARVTAFTPDRELSSQIWYSTKSQTIFPVLVLHPPYLLNHANKSTHQRMWEQPLSLWRVNLLYRAQLEGVMLALKALFHRGLLRQSLGCEKTGGVTPAQRNNNNCTQLLPSFPGGKKKYARLSHTFHLLAFSQQFPRQWTRLNLKWRLGDALEHI